LAADLGVKATAVAYRLAAVRKLWQSIFYPGTQNKYSTAVNL